MLVLVVYIVVAAFYIGVVVLIVVEVFIKVEHLTEADGKRPAVTYGGISMKEDCCCCCCYYDRAPPSFVVEKSPAQRHLLIA